MSLAIGDYPGSSVYGLQKSGPIEDYALADLYAWLVAHSELTNPAAGRLPTTSIQSSNSTAK